MPDSVSCVCSPCLPRRGQRRFETLLAVAAGMVGLFGTRVSGQIGQDDFEDLAGWSTDASQETSVEIARDTGHTGMGMRIDFDFHASGGFVIVRKAFPLSLPANYAFRFFVRGEAPPNNL